MKGIVLVAVAALALVSNAPSAVPANSWTQSKVERYLTIGPFAMRNKVKHADCVGTGTAYYRADERAYETFWRYKTFNCSLLNRGFEEVGQIKVTVTGNTTFRVVWLKQTPCPQ